MSSLRKLFSSNSVLRIVQIYFCLISTIWTIVQAEYYEVESLNNFDFDNGGQSMTIMNNAYLFITRHNQNFYTAQLEQIEISMSDKFSDLNINISGCSNFKPVANALRKPFKVFLDDSGKFKSMKVQKDDVDLSIDMKFFLAVALQANKQKLQEQTVSGNKFKFYDNEFTRLGKCDVTNSGSKVGEQSYRIQEHKVTHRTCHSFEPPAYADDKQYLEKICRNISEGNAKYYRYIDTIDVNFKGMTEFNTIDVHEALFYKPWKGSEDLFESLYTISFVLNPEWMPPDLRKRKGSNREAEAFNDDDSKEISELQYINVDRSIIGGSKNNLPIKIYKAIACKPLKKSAFAAIVLEAIKCL